MSTTIATQTCVLVLNQVDASLEDLATALAWRIRCSSPLRELIQELSLDTPDTIVVQINGRIELDPAATLAAHVRRVCEKARLCAWAVEHEPAIELTMRSQGVHVYLAGQTGLHALQRIGQTNRRRAGPVTSRRPLAARTLESKPDHESVVTHYK